MDLQRITRGLISLSPLLLPHQLSGLYQLIHILIKPDKICNTSSPSLDMTWSDNSLWTGRGLLLAHYMGLGKTATIITFLAVASALASLSNHHYRGRECHHHCTKSSHVLVIVIAVPTSAVSQWFKEVDKWWSFATTNNAKHPTNNNISIKPVIIDATRCRRDSNDRTQWHRTALSEITRQSFHLTPQCPVILLISHRMLGSSSLDQCLSQLTHGEGGDLLVCDEAHRLSYQTLAGAAARRCLVSAVVGLTGYPLQNNLEELWGQLALCSGYSSEFKHQKPLPPRLTFKRDIAIPIEQAIATGWSESNTTAAATTALATLKELMIDRVHRVPSTVLTALLPPLIEWDVTVACTKDQRGVIQRICDSGASLLVQANWITLTSLHSEVIQWDWCKESNQSEDITRHLTEKRTRNDSVGKDLIYFVNNPTTRTSVPSLPSATTTMTVSIGSGGKCSVALALLLHFLQSTTLHILVMSHYALSLQFLLRQLHHHHQDVSHHPLPILYMDGESTERESLIESFQSSSGPIALFVTLRTGGVALNLTRASIVLLLDPHWNPSHEIQAIHRAHRIGQTQPVTVYRLLTEHVDDPLREFAHRKRLLAAHVLDEANKDALTTFVEKNQRFTLGDRCSEEYDLLKFPNDSTENSTHLWSFLVKSNPSLLPLIKRISKAPSLLPSPREDLLKQTKLNKRLTNAFL